MTQRPDRRKPSPKRPAPSATKRQSSARAGTGRTQWYQRSSTAFAVGGVAVLILAGLAIHPLRTWMAQREQLAETEAELVQVETEVAELERQLDLLQTDAEVERRARRDFYLVYPGEESYRILPPGTGD